MLAAGILGMRRCGMIGNGGALVATLGEDADGEGCSEESRTDWSRPVHIQDVE